IKFHKEIGDSMAKGELTIIEHIGEVALITMNNPPVNTISTVLMEALHEALDRLEQDDTVKVICLRGANGHFMAGAELKEFAETDSKEGGSHISYLGQQLMHRIERFSKPIIALIEGACLGGGLELALACHIRLGVSGS